MNNKLSLILKISAIIELIVFCALLIVLVGKIYAYNYLGDYEFFWEDNAKCIYAVGCQCQNKHDKCSCIYYNDEKNRQEKIKCNPVIEN